MNEEEREILRLVKKYERSQDSGEKIWFDSEDYVDIIDWYHDNDMENKAIEVTHKAYGLFPDDEEVAMRMADVYVSDGKYDKALESLQECLKNTPSSYVYGTLAGIYIESNTHIQEAEDILKKLISDGDDYYYNYYLMGRIYLMRGLYEKAEPLIRKALYEDDQDGAIALNYVKCADYPSLRGRVIKTLSNITQQHPFNDTIWCFLGALYYETDQYEQAIESLRYAIAIDDEDETRHAILADILFAVSKDEEFVQESLRAAEYSKEPFNYYNNIANTFMVKKDYNMAETYYRKAMELENGAFLPNTILGLTHCYFALQRDILAKELLAKAWSLGFESKYFLDFAEKLHDSGLIDESKEIFLDLTNDEDDDIVLACYIALSYINAEENNILQAIKILEDCIRINLFSDDVYFAMLEIACMDSNYYSYVIKALRYIMKIEDFQKEIENNYPNLLNNTNYIKALNELQNA